MEYIIVQCPHCTEQIQIFQTEINCAIFRHGVIKQTMQQLNPHESKENCDRFATEDLIFGCGKPFKLVKEPNQEPKKNNETYTAVVCDYI